MEKVALSGTCYWCTEAIFQSLKGVSMVEQGWLALPDEDNVFTEGVIVHFDPDIISLKTLIEIHLHTHSSTSNHSMRKKYRSAVYIYSDQQRQIAQKALEELQANFDKPLITKVLSFQAFNSSDESIQNYYYTRPEKPFCTNIIAPKLRLLMEQFGSYTKGIKLKDQE